MGLKGILQAYSTYPSDKGRYLKENQVKYISRFLKNDKNVVSWADANQNIVNESSQLAHAIMT